jgi:hypothetical protein
MPPTARHCLAIDPPDDDGYYDDEDEDEDEDDEDEDEDDEMQVIEPPDGY